MAACPHYSWQNGVKFGTTGPEICGTIKQIKHFRLYGGGYGGSDMAYRSTYMA